MRALAGLCAAFFVHLLISGLRSAKTGTDLTLWHPWVALGIATVVIGVVAAVKGGVFDEGCAMCRLKDSELQKLRDALVKS